MYLIAASAGGDVALSLSGAPPHGDSLSPKKKISSRAFEQSFQSGIRPNGFNKQFNNEPYLESLVPTWSSIAPVADIKRGRKNN